MRWLLFILILPALVVRPACAQDGSSSFVDGFHGGVYGHYPLTWYTDFMVDQLEAHPQWRINLELEPETWDSVRSLTPEAYERFRKVVAGPQVEVVNPTYAQPYLYNISGESIIRQFQMGMKKWREHFPDVQFLSYSSEEPCFTSCLPTVLKQLGFRYISLKCPDTCWGGYMAPMGGQFIRLIGPDGSALPCVPRYDCEALQDSSVWQTIAWKNSPEYLKACAEAGIENPVGMCLQDAGWKGGPWMGTGRRNHTAYTLWRDYFARFLPQVKLKERPFHQEDVRPALMWGTHVLQIIAQKVRCAENHLVQTEKLCAMAALEGHGISTSRMEEAWRTLLLSQHHDSWIVPLNTLRRHRSWAHYITNVWIPQSLSISDSMRREAIGISAVHPKKVRIYNTTGHDRLEWVSIPLPGERKVDIEAKVPAFGYAEYPLPSETVESATATQFPTDATALLENDRMRIELDLERGGAVRKLYLKEGDGMELAPANGLFSLGELRGYFRGEGRFCSSTENKATARWISLNQACQRLLVSGTIAGNPFRKTITLKKGSPLIDVRLHIDWDGDLQIGEPTQKGWPMRRRAFYDTRYMLNLLFPTRLSRPQLFKDAPFDVCQSQQAETFFNRWDSIRHNVVLHWLDLSDGKGGLALFTDHTTSYSYGQDFPLGLTVQYAGPALWGKEYQVSGHTEIHYALMPHRGEWSQAHIQAWAQDWQEPLIPVLMDSDGSTQEHSFIRCGEGLELSAVTMEKDKLTFRVFNAGGKDGEQVITLAGEAQDVVEVNLNGEPLRNITFRPNRKKGRTELNPALPRFGLGTYQMKWKRK